MTRVSYAVEGWSDEPIAEALIRHVGLVPWQRFVARGKHLLDPKLPGYNVSARQQPWLVLRDMDDDAPCAGDLAKRLIGEPSRAMALRIPVRALESWLLADRQAFATHFRVAVAKVPVEPDLLDDPKRKVVDLCRSSRSSAVKAAMVPSVSSGRKVGKEFEAWLREYAVDSWRIEEAARASPSLSRSLDRLQQLVESKAWANE